ncbi:MAG: phosphoribosylglycinamide formyltransferase [Flavobacteriales bacterium]
MNHIAIFASGAGTNAGNIIRYFDQRPTVRVELIVSGRADAGVVGIAREAGIHCESITKEMLGNTDELLKMLGRHDIDLIVLAGFLWLIPLQLIRAYPQRIINIHPALLPKYGGKGMYGAHVHRAVIAAGERESGISIHYVNEQYDEGAIIFQASCPVLPTDTADVLAARIHKLEYAHYPKVIEQLLSADGN